VLQKSFWTGAQKFYAARGRDKDEHGNVVADYTLWTSASDLKAKRFYFRSSTASIKSPWHWCCRDLALSTSAG
jgi:hypothetical protein